MNTSFFERGLLDWFQENEREGLPWRKKEVHPYEIWVSEIMLQQTQVVRVILYYQKFLKRFPTIVELASVSWEEFIPYYSGLGYYRRGRNMLATAQKVVDEFQGEFPQTKTELMTLPGVGLYTANAILSFGYGQDTLAWDTNLKKVFGRYFFGNKSEKFSEEAFDTKIKTEKKYFNAAVMDFSNVVCKKVPLCEACPLKKYCNYFKTKGKLEISDKKTSQNTFSTKSARAYIFLHKEHREYFSSRVKKYKPFVLPKGCVSRKSIKGYFKEKYNLDVAVRPEHKRGYIKGEPVLLINAQILLGEQKFSVFDKQRAHDMIQLIQFDT